MQKQEHKNIVVSTYPKYNSHIYFTHSHSVSIPGP